MYKLPDDAYGIVLAWCTTSELGRMEQVRPVPAAAWARVARVRAGAPWAASKRGLHDMYAAIHRPQVPRQLTARCFAVRADGRYAAGVDNGYYMDSTHVPGPCVDSLAWHGNELIVCSLQTGEAYTAAWTPLGRFLCVSGPVDVRGTVVGTVPVCALPYPCTRIMQSSTRVAAWHTSGHVAVFSVAIHLLAVIDTNTVSPRHMSVIGDVVCVAGYAWHDDRCLGTCPRDARDTYGESYILAACPW